MSSPERRRRAVNKLAVSAAALAVCVFPTGCDYSLASPPSVGSPAAPGGGQNGAVTTAPVVVPVGNTTQTRSRDGDRDRNRGRGTRTKTRTRISPPAATSTVIAEPGAPAPGDPTDTTTTVPPTTTTDPAATTTTTAPPTALPPGAIDGKPPTGTNGLAILGRRCADSKLAPHEGFQDPKSLCVDTAMGEVAAEDRLPSLLITAAPKTVAVDQAFMIEVSTRNLVRDRFLGAAVGGYYLESSFLNDAGLQRGHFHTACRILASTTAAPDSSKAPEFFLATQDGGGGTGADTVTIPVPGIKTAGELQCTSWAGDGSHRTPMMSRANQTPAIDSVRITVGGNAPAGAVAPQPDVNAADAKADAAAQTEAQAKEEASQKPDQDGAPQPGADDTLPGGAAGAPAAPAADPAPADAPAADPAPADSSDADAPATDTATQDAGN